MGTGSDSVVYFDLILSTRSSSSRQASATSVAASCWLWCETSHSRSTRIFVSLPARWVRAVRVRAETLTASTTSRRGEVEARVHADAGCDCGHFESRLQFPAELGRLVFAGKADRVHNEP